MRQKIIPNFAIEILSGLPRLSRLNPNGFNRSALRANFANAKFGIIIILISSSILICAAHIKWLPAISLNLYADECPLVQEKSLDLSEIFITTYALGGDVSEIKEKKEGIYLAKGDVNNSLAVLKNILIEHRHPFYYFEEGEQISAIIFRGILLKQGKIAISKVIYKETSFEVYAHYDDIPDLDIPSQPAAIIPLGKLPIGKYRIKLYVEGQESKQKDFIVKRSPFRIDFTKN